MRFERKNGSVNLLSSNFFVLSCNHDWLSFKCETEMSTFPPFLFCSHLPHFTRISTGPHPWSWQLPEKGAKFVPPTILLTCDNDQSPWRLWSWSALNFYNIIHIISRAFVCDIWPTLIMNFRVNEIILMKKKPYFLNFVYTVYPIWVETHFSSAL